MTLEIRLKGRGIPRTPDGDADFTQLGISHEEAKKLYDAGMIPKGTVLDVFTPDEVCELINRSIYQLEYQAEAHRKHAAVRRARDKALRQALKGDRTEIDKQLKGD